MTACRRGDNINNTAGCTTKSFTGPADFWGNGIYLLHPGTAANTAAPGGHVVTFRKRYTIGSLPGIPADRGV